MNIGCPGRATSQGCIKALMRQNSANVARLGIAFQFMSIVDRRRTKPITRLAL